MPPLTSAAKAVVAASSRHDVASPTSAAATMNTVSSQRNPILTLDLVTRIAICGQRFGLDRLFLDPQRNTHNVLITPHLDDATARRIKVMLSRGTAMLVVLVMGEETDPAAVHRVASLGCGVVELQPGASIGRTFTRVVGAGAR